MRMKQKIGITLCCFLAFWQIYGTNVLGEPDTKKAKAPVSEVATPVEVEVTHPQLKALNTCKKNTEAKLAEVKVRLEETKNKDKNSASLPQIQQVVKDIEKTLKDIDAQIKLANKSVQKVEQARKVLEAEEGKLSEYSEKAFTLENEAFKCARSLEEPVENTQEKAEGKTTEAKELALDSTPRKVNLNAEQKEVRESLNVLAWKLFNKCGTQQICPYSAAIILNMLREGADGSTATEIGKFMGTKIQGNEYFAGMMPDSAEEKKPLKIYTLAAFQDGLDIQQQYTDFVTNSKIHDEVTIGNSPFATKPQEEMKELNDWFSEKTNGEISQVFSKISPQTQAVFANVTLFDGLWEVPFETTIEQDFFLMDGKTQKMPMMQGLMNVGYYKSPKGDCEVLVLPYRNNTGMVILLPKDGSVLKQIQASQKDYNVDWFMDSIKKSKKTYCEISMPKFRKTGSLDMIPVFSQIGLKETFSVKANFSKITGKDSLEIGQFLQDVVLDVNEAGTKATAATTSTLVLKSAKPRAKVKVEVNRPFIYAIIDNPKSVDVHTILFMGIMDGYDTEAKNE